MGVYKVKSSGYKGSSNRSNALKDNYWRNSYNYREEYFKRNPGLFGFMWFCSQCGRPLFGKNQVQVDHIIPPSKFARKRYNRNGELIKNTSFMAETMNNRFNLVATCAKCNRKKSDDIGLCTVKGGVAKVFETVLFGTQRLLTLTGRVMYKGGKAAARKGAKEFKKKNTKGKIITIGVLVGLAFLVYSNFV